MALGKETNKQFIAQNWKTSLRKVKYEKDKMDEWIDTAKTATIKWVAVDSSGAVYGYAKRPFADTFLGRWDTTSYFLHLGGTQNKELIEDWEKSLRKVNYER